MDKKNTNKGDIAKTAAGGTSAVVGGAILLKALKTKKLTPKEEKEVIEIVKKKPGEYLYRRAVKNRSLRKATRRAARNAAGSRGAGWLGGGERAFSNNIEDDNTMEIRRKVFSLLQDENGEERYYSTNEFELSWDEETGEKMFSEKESKLEKSGRGYGTAIAYGGLSGALAVKAGRNAAKKVEKEGASEAEMIDAAGKKSSRVSGAIQGTAVGVSAGTVGVLAHKLSKNPEFREQVKEAALKSGDKEAYEMLRKLGKGKKVGAIAAGAAAAASLPAAIIAARRAGDGARKNVTKGLAKGHKKEKNEE